MLMAKELLRSIKKSWTTFLSLSLIVALGSGFFAGLNSTGAAMRSAVNQVAQKTNLADITLVSSAGFDDAQIEYLHGKFPDIRIREGRVFDCLADIQALRSAFRVHELKAQDQGTLHIIEGRLPKAADECAISNTYLKNTDIALGSHLSILESTASDAMLNQSEFTVVGIIESPMYLNRMMAGYTAQENGILRRYIYVDPAAFKADAPWTQLSIRDVNLAGYAFESNVYQTELKALVDQLTDIVPTLSSMRLTAIKHKATEKLDEAKEVFDAKQQEAKFQLDQAREKLAANKQLLDDKASEIAAGKARLTLAEGDLQKEQQAALEQLVQGKQRLATEQQKLLDARLHIGMTQEEVTSKISEIKAAQASLGKLDKARSALREAKVSLDVQEAASSKLFVAAHQELKQHQAELVRQEQELQAIQAQKAELTLDIERLEQQYEREPSAQLEQELAQKRAALEQLPDIDAMQASLDKARAQLAQEEATLKDQEIQAHKHFELARNQLIEQQAEIDAGYKLIGMSAAEVDAALVKLQEAQAALSRIAAGEEEIAAQTKILNAQETEAHAKLAAARSLLEVKSRELVEGESRLAQGLASYNAGLHALEGKECEAQTKLADAREHIREAERKIEDLETPSITVLDRFQNFGFAEYQRDSLRIDKVGKVFPLFFFLVASLVSLTTMTRMVEDERTEIGCYKALGFSKLSIAAKYLIYAGSASGLGALVGIAMLTQLLPRMIIGSYQAAYSIAFTDTVLVPDVSVVLISLVLGMGSVLVATAICVLHTLSEKPASLLLPRAPKPGKRILLERLSVWKHLSFSWKVTLRNLFRYKVRLGMSVVGIAGCCALLVTGFGLRDAIGSILERQLTGKDAISNYDLVISATDAGSVSGIEKQLETAGAYTQVRCAVFPADIENASHRATQEETYEQQLHSHNAVSIVIPQQTSELKDVVNLKTPEGAPIAFTNNSCVLTHKMADLLQVQPGDIVRLNIVAAGDTHTSKTVELKLTDICENYMFNYCYVAPTVWEQAAQDKALYDTLLCDMPHDKLADKQFIAGLMRDKGIRSVQTNQERIDAFEDNIHALNRTMVIFIGAALALATLVLYNLTNINIIERRREIASLKVLGFKAREVDDYIFREIFCSVCIGVIVGLVFGTLLEGFVVASAEKDILMFSRDISLVSYIEAACITLIGAVGIMGMLRYKLRKINMPESLKSVD